jgi:nucleotide-binding universal stress UspA family protein
MEHTILVTTDCSVNSKAGIRFAIQLASEHAFSLIFLQIIELLIPTRWNDVKAKVHADEVIMHEQDKLEKFVKETFRESNAKVSRFECVVRYGAPVSSAIINYAAERKVDFICLATRGAGRVRRIIGTHTSAVIKHSLTPVFVVPRNYRRTRVTHILYASDFADLRNELTRVKRFAGQVKSKISVLHYDYFLQVKEAKADFEKDSKANESSGVKFYLQKFDWEESLAAHLTSAIRKFKPSVVALFTKQDRNWYQRVFLSSRSADVSYDTKKPLLVFPKGKD